MNLTGLADRLHGSSIAVKSKTLFLEMMPAEAELAVLLRSPITGTKIDYELPGYFRTEFQVIVRTVGYPDGEALMKRVVTKLTMDNTVVGTQSFQYCRPRFLPVAFPLSRGNLVEHTVTFDCCFVVSP